MVDTTLANFYSSLTPSSSPVSIGNLTFQPPDATLNCYNFPISIIQSVPSDRLFGILFSQYPLRSTNAVWDGLQNTVYPRLRIACQTTAQFFQELQK